MAGEDYLQSSIPVSRCNYRGVPFDITGKYPLDSSKMRYVSPPFSLPERMSHTLIMFERLVTKGESYRH